MTLLRFISIVLVLSNYGIAMRAFALSGQVTIDVAHPGAIIDRHLFGQFAEHLGRGIYDGIWVGPESPIPNTRGIRSDVVGALQALHVPVVRWPGGCFAETYHWQNGVGPRRVRPAGMNFFWAVPESNAFGTQEFLDFAEQIGAQPYIAANVGSGSPREMAEWVEYLTASAPDSLAIQRARDGHPQPVTVSYLGIGNESYGCGGSMTPEYYLGEAKRFTTYVDPSAPIKKVAVGPGGDDTRWTEVMMKAWSQRIEGAAWGFDGLSLHFYTFAQNQQATGFGEDQYAAVIAESLKLGTTLDKHIAIMDRYDPKKKVELDVDEWGAWYAPTPGTNPDLLMQQNTQRDAIMTALGLDLFARRERVRMANIAQLVNVLQSMILTDGPRIVLTPTYHVFRLYTPFQDAVLLPVRVDANPYSHGKHTLPRLDSLAARAKDGSIYLALTNLDPHVPLEVEATLTGTHIDSASGETLTSTTIDGHNDFDHPDRVFPGAAAPVATNGTVRITLAPESVTVLKLSPGLPTPR